MNARASVSVSRCSVRTSRANTRVMSNRVTSSCASWMLGIEKPVMSVETTIRMLKESTR